MSSEAERLYKDQALIHEIGVKCNLHEVTGKSYQLHGGESSIESLVRDMAEEILRLQKNQKEIFRAKEPVDNVRAVKAEQKVFKLQKILERYKASINNMKWTSKFVADNEHRSKILTSLHYVWCLGYCHAPLESMTPYMIDCAENHVKTMKNWWKHYNARQTFTLKYPDSQDKEKVEEYWKLFREHEDMMYNAEVEKGKAEVDSVKEKKVDLVLRNIDRLEKELLEFEKEMEIG